MFQAFELKHSREQSAQLLSSNLLSRDFVLHCVQRRGALQSVSLRFHLKSQMKNELLITLIGWQIIRNQLVNINETKMERELRVETHIRDLDGLINKVII